VDPRLQTTSVQRQLASLIRSDARRGAQGAIAHRAAEALGPGEHTTNEIVDRAMTDAMATWARFNPPGGQNGKYLSKSEIKRIARADPELGALTDTAAKIVRRRRAGPARVQVGLTSSVPGVRLASRGDRYTVHADASVPQNTRFTLTIAGQDTTLVRLARGINAIDLGAPEGYNAVMVDRKLGEGDVSITFQITRDPPGSLTSAQAYAKAKEGLIEYLKTERMGDDDWREYFPHTWDEAVAGGIMAAIDRFLDPANPETEIARQPDRFVFVGRGPYDLYTEVEIDKRDGKVLRAYVEID
jgi:hypothetical protein